MVRVVGLEPTLLSEPDFESGASSAYLNLVAALVPSLPGGQHVLAFTLPKENPPMCILQPENAARQFEGLSISTSIVLNRLSNKGD
ncbi:hypothetical protein NM963_04615 [Agrobacterium tumefaciens]|uniref:hypothetical protein n=1 Tax=Agrobacterium tumefaciens TaxID=358 RepID=UPI002244C4EF|nr:hypothetical protein [Agrobacterium tumefaciens]MCW8143095.1 hypothetical protein [Agrobacterium tumefaciens]